MEDATWRQVQALHPESPIPNDNTSIHKIAQKLSTTRQTKPQVQRLLLGGRPSHRGGPATKAWPQRDTKNNSEHTCPNCASNPHRSREECPAIDQECYHCGKTGHFSKACRRNPNQNKSMVNHIQKDNQFVDSRQQPLDQIQNECEYALPYLTENKRAPVNNLRSTTKIHYMCHLDPEHIRLLWVSKPKKAKFTKLNMNLTWKQAATSCQSTSHNSYSAGMTSSLRPSKVHIEAFGSQPVHSLGSCILYLHIDIKISQPSSK